MKNNKKWLGLLLCAMLVLSCALASAETYEVSGSGYGGKLDLTVTIDNGVITDIALGENHETNVVIDRAFPVIRERILEANSPVVDSVSAATFSSFAVKTAVAEAMKQAGMDAPSITMATAGEEKPATERAAETCDIVIVGGGPAGLAAAIGAKQTKPDANVIVVEKLDILSGNGKFDMNFFDIINTEAQKKAGNEEWTVNQVAHFIEEKSKSGESAERIEVWANQENILDAWLRDMGVELNYNYGGTNHLAEANQYAGEVIQAGLERTAYALNADVRTGTKGVDLVMEDGACKGVIDFVGAENMAYINVANRLSVDCDCDGNPHEPEMGDLGIFASLDPVAVDQACYDAVKNAEDPGKAALIERMDSRHGIHTVETACERHHLGLRDYEIVSID